MFKIAAKRFSSSTHPIERERIPSVAGSNSKIKSTWQRLRRVDPYEMLALFAFIRGNKSYHTDRETVNVRFADCSRSLLPVNNPTRLGFIRTFRRWDL